MPAPAGTIDLTGAVCVMCGHKLKAKGKSVVCQCGARFGRFARYAYTGNVKGGARPRRAVPIEPDEPMPDPPPVQAELEALRVREAKAVERERALRPSRGWRAEMLAAIEEEHRTRPGRGP